MNIAERVIAFFQKNRGRPFCDECVMAELNIVQPRSREVVSNTIKILVPSFVQRGLGLCSRCELEKPTTTARLDPAAVSRPKIVH